MKFAIIAAGEGSRLANEGVKQPKPLVEIAGESLIDRLLRIFADHHATEIVVICNEYSQEVIDHLRNIQNEGFNGRNIPLRFVIRTTPSSMHSFYEISRYLSDDIFCLTTVDTIFKESEFGNYLEALHRFTSSENFDGVMGVTDFIDDEKPLYISTDDNDIITGFFDRQNSCHLISGGIYGLSPKVLPILQHCIDTQVTRMRNFQRALVDEGCRLKAYSFSKILDIDHAGDIDKASTFLKEHDPLS